MSPLIPLSLEKKFRYFCTFCTFDIFAHYCAYITKKIKSWYVPTVVSSIGVVGALTRCAFLHSVYDLKVAQKNIPRSLIPKRMLHEFDLATTPPKQPKTFVERYVKVQFITGRPSSGVSWTREHSRTHGVTVIPNLLRRLSSEGCRFNPDYWRVTV